MKVLIRNRNDGQFYSDGRKKPANWEWRFVGASVDGKRKNFSKSGFRTKKEAQEAGAKALNEYVNSGSVFTPNSISVSDYMWLWLKEYGETNLKETTIHNYRKALKNHILPEIGDYYLKDLTSMKLQELINLKFNQGYSINRLTEIKGILSVSLSYAVEPGRYISQNPMAYVRMPNKRAVSDVPTRKKERRAVTDKEWEEIMERFPEGHPAHIPLILAYRCGLRKGEAFGLLWEDIDLDAGTMMIQRQIQYNHTKKVWEFTPPKYDSYRTITVDASTVAVLRREKEKQRRAVDFYAEYYKQLCVAHTRPTEHLYDYGEIGYEGEPIHMVMCRESGEIIHERIMQHVGRVIHGHESTPTISVDWDYHSLRHTHATMLLDMGIPMQMIQERLGHATIKSTNVYTHATENMRMELADRLNRAY